MKRTSTTVSVLALIVAGSLPIGCLDRPVAAMDPNTSNTYIDLVRQDAIDKVDLLFMIDNSQSMADKQRLLQQAVPDLVKRLVNPSCVQPDPDKEDALLVQETQPTSPDEDCAEGFYREFRPLRDFHIGVVSSSLGSRGTDMCTPQISPYNATMNDRAHLLGGVRPELGSYAGHGFLAWDPDAEKAPAGESNLATLLDDFTHHVAAAGDDGCGYEASLESWYRFLVDPDPAQVVAVPCFDGDSELSCRQEQGTDEALLAQRQAFLRPDSLLAVVMLSDENDCSVRAEPGYSTVLTALRGDRRTAWRMPRATSECVTDPSSPCCYSCAPEVSTPAACLEANPGHDRDSDPSCAENGGYYTAEHDDTNLRCFDQKRRYGIDFLYPTSRYVRGLTDATVVDRHGNEVANPIFSDLTGAGAPPRDPSRIILTGLVGVPHQDITEGSRLLTRRELDDEERWEVILGDPASHVPPSDPHMVESSEPRPAGASNPLRGVDASIVTDPSAPPSANPINGRERQTNGGDLQYACIFPLMDNGVPTPIPCTENGDTLLCQNSAGEVVTGENEQPLQFYAKAYPGLRQLQVLRDFENSVVASVCPWNLQNANDADYGYRPAIAALGDRISDVLGGQCLPRPLDPKEDGLVDCVIVEATPTAGQGCDATGQQTGSARPAREEANPKLIEVAKRRMEDQQVCAGAACNDYTFCAINPVQSEALTQCQENPAEGKQGGGFCYVDADQGIGNPDLVARCPANKRRMLRFVGQDIPRSGATTLIACRGASLDD